MAADFELVDRSKSRAEYAYGSNSQELGAIYVTRLSEGWTVVGYELCPGAF